ncbi:SNF2 domain-containing protein CLASSY 4-like [Sesamum indicum]|uniref:SNF2 domain-containing protein CLASSY 4-like n=1 Tax=Sesamum indicum TaxID=4182 RepID=A0A6I9TWT9_SESIN|nr:SNF2 domain-containing protein CLASSY 4-like [Sesamum indicum]
MCASRTPTSAASRRRTRRQWDEYYRNYYDELKGIEQESGGTGGRDKQDKNVVDSESIILDGDGGKSWEKQGFVLIGEKRIGEEKIQQAGSFGGRSVKTENAVQEFDVSRSIRGFGGERMEEKEDNGVAQVGRAVWGRKKLDLRARDDGDCEFECLGEEVVSNCSTLKIGPESRSGSVSKVGNLDEVVSCTLKRTGSPRVGADNGGNNRQRGRGRPGIEPLDSNHMPDDIAASLENSVDSGNSTKMSDGSDDSVDSSDAESTSEEEDESSDEDYNADERLASDDSDVSYYGSDVEGEKDVEDDAYENEKKESDIEQENGNDSEDDYNGDDEQDNVNTVIDDKDKFSSARKSTGISGKKENDIKQGRDDEIDESFNATHDGSGHNKASADRKKDGNLVIIIDDDEKSPSVRKSARTNRTRDSELAGLNRIFEPHANYRCMDETGRNEVCRGSFAAGNARKEANHNSNENWIKKRKINEFEILVDCDKSNDKEERSLSKCPPPGTISKSEKEGPVLGGFCSPVPTVERGVYTSMDDESISSGDKGSCHTERVLERGLLFSKKGMKLGKRKTHAARNLDLIKILVASINSLKEEQCPIEDYVPAQNTLPLKFRFEDEVQPSPEKSEWEKQMDSLFCDLELGLRETEIHRTKPSVIENDVVNPTEMDRSPAACCGRGEHQPILDEQIGLVCRYCYAVILDIKHVLPPFYTPPSWRRDRKDFDDLPSSIISQIQFQDSASGSPNSIDRAKGGTVWDLIAGVEKEMYPHQREGFEFMWKNIAGDIRIEKLKQPLPDGGRGCIISHAPGTGKTRLTIMFLLTFLKLYPTCRPVIIAPRGMLLTWESEFIKWHVHIPFHNLNKEELSGEENAIAANIIGQVGGGGGMSRDYIRLLKLYSWMKGRSILGVSYKLFEKLAGEKGKKGQNEQIRKVLRELPGLLVLDEGHTPRNNQSLIWKTLTKVATQRRIILSGTPFQNNLTELYNTLCLVNPKFDNHLGSEYNISRSETHGRKGNFDRKKWINLTSSIGKNSGDGLNKLKAMLDPFVHVHKGTILQESLLGLRDTLVFLHPTELQKTLLENASKSRHIFHRIRMVSLISVHPSLAAVGMGTFSAHKSKLEEIELDIEAGVKTKFVVNLIWLADALGERVLVFSQYIDPLVFIKNRITSHFSWSEGKEVLYMDGQLDVNQRQDSISSFNDDTGEAKVLLASERACSEGINLVGASRVVLLDTVWNPSIEKQAISRAYRLGQKKVVYVYRLFTSGTEVKIYAQQVQKQRMSQLIFSPRDGQACQSDKSPVVSRDKVLEAMLGDQKFGRSFEKIIHQPKESDLIEIFGLVDQQ